MFRQALGHYPEEPNMRQVMMSSEAQRDIGRVLMDMGAHIASGHVRDVVLADGVGTLESVAQELGTWAEERDFGADADINEMSRQAIKRLWQRSVADRITVAATLGDSR